MPHTAMISVALRREVTKGARIMALANTQCEMMYAVRREGLNFSMPSTKEASFAGGRAVYGGSASSGLLTTKGSSTDMMNVMMENPMSAREPMRPTWPVISSEALTSAGAS